jgi:DNA-binding CsgD family transcriptional regulator
MGNGKDIVMRPSPGRGLKAFAVLPAEVPVIPALAVVLFLGVCLLRLVVRDNVDDVLFLLVLPMGMLGAELGWRAGMGAAALALAVVAAFDSAYDVGLSAAGYSVRAVVFLGVGGLTAALRESRAVPDPASETRLLTAKPQIHAVPQEVERLSRRELEVLELIARGATNAQIADRFVISEDTVKSHVKRILRKLDVGNRTAAAFRYIERFGQPARHTDDKEPVEPIGLADQQDAHFSEIGAASEVRARVVVPAADEGVLLKLEDGRSLEVPLVDPMRDRFDSGSPALVYFDQVGHTVGWYLPDVELGVDMRY